MGIFRRSRAANSAVGVRIYRPRYHACGDTIFQDYSPMGDICHGNQSSEPICSKTCFSLQLQIKFDQDWPYLSSNVLTEGRVHKHIDAGSALYCNLTFGSGQLKMCSLVVKRKNLVNMIYIKTVNINKLIVMWKTAGHHS